ncbi:alcohol dehydrogenase [Penicillium angulare]|uniref:alcohol dehydrogenase n=1 Tax=Penicillium angulare TaxID=116970 RepID=UPI0025400259|nr:alcohol dehydrogenase [Penicillium angulare]KAJ5272586.1 alcohol dehydrogenase [Penicillium angulare]
MSLPAPPEVSFAAIQDQKTKTISVTQRQTPIPVGTQVLVKINYSGVCATDLHLARGNIPYLQPKVSVGGHEGTGVIASLGAEADTTKWHIGDRVAVRWVHIVCGTCEVCTTGYENLCQSRQLAGKDVEGTFAEYAIADSSYMVRLPEGVTDADAAPILCAGVTVYKALKIANLRKGSWVAVPGAGGGLGHLAIQYARAMGFNVVALDVNKRAFCLSLGADVYIDVLETTNCVSDVIQATGGGAHGALICASSAQAYTDAIGFLRRTGSLVCIGLPAKAAKLPLGPEDFVARGIKVMGTSTGDRQDTLEALDFVARGEVKPQLIERSIEDIEKILKELENGTSQGKSVIKIS